MSLFADSQGVNEIGYGFQVFEGIGLVLSEKLFEIFEKADQDHHRRADQTGEEQDLQKAEQVDSKVHTSIIRSKAQRNRKDAGAGDPSAAAQML